MRSGLGIELGSVFRFVFQLGIEPEAQCLLVLKLKFLGVRKKVDSENTPRKGILAMVLLLEPGSGAGI